jgi:hypothetical protein
MSIIEKHQKARLATNLKPSADTVDAALDVLGAAGFAAKIKDNELGMLLNEVRIKPTRQNLYSTYEGLKYRLRKHALAKGMKVDCEVIVNQVIGWWLGGVCKACSGQKWKRVEGTPALSTTVCQTCHGTGKPRLKTKNDDAAAWAQGLMERLHGVYGGAINNALGR